jgi:lipoprotein-releasing system permease protein
VRTQLAIARAYVTSRPRQTMVSVLGVMMGVGFYVGISALMQGFQQDFVRRIVDISPHIIIRDEFRLAPPQPVVVDSGGAAVELRGVKPRDEPRGIRSADQILDGLQREPGMRIAPTLTGQAFLRYGGRDTAVTLLGIEPEKERRVSSLAKDMVEGTLDDLVANANGIIVGTGVAKKAGLKRGSNVSVVSSYGVTLQMKVVGLFETGIVQLDDAQGYVQLKKNQVLQRRTDVINQIRIRLDDIDRADEVARHIEARHAYKTESWRESNQNIFGIFVIQNGIMYSTVGAILIVSGFGIYNIVSTVVNEKRHDVAILKSIGFSEGDIRRIFLMQGLIVGVVGTLLGWLLGYLLIQLLASIRFDIQGMIRTQGFVLNRSLWAYAIAGFIAIGVSTLAAYLPARRAAALNPVDVIRGGA